MKWRWAHEILTGLLLIASGICFGQPTYRASTNLVNVAFSVRDASGAPVGNVTQEDLEVFEDGIPQKIAFFSRSLDVPLTLGLVVDISESQHHFYKQHKQDLEVFLKTVLGPRDRAFLVCFGDHLRLVSDLSQSGSELLDRFEQFDHSNLRKAKYQELGPLEDRDGGTAFYDAIFYSVTEKLSKETGRRALLIFSDGEDNSSAYDELSTIEAAQNADVTLYTIRYTHSSHGGLSAHNKYGIRVMNRMAEETGGGKFDAKRMNPHEYLREIADDLRTSYDLAYYPARPLKEEAFRKLTIRPRRSGLSIRCKTGYFPREIG